MNGINDHIYFWNLFPIKSPSLMRGLIESSTFKSFKLEIDEKATWGHGHDTGQTYFNSNLKKTISHWCFNRWKTSPNKSLMIRFIFIICQDLWIALFLTFPIQTTFGRGEKGISFANFVGWETLQYAKCGKWCNVCKNNDFRSVLGDDI